MRTFNLWLHQDIKLWFFIYVSVLLLLCCSCSDTDRVNYSAVADLKDPLIAKVHNYVCHVYLIACVTLQSFAKNISLRKITTAAPPLLPSCYCNYFPPFHHYHTTLMPTIIIHQNCTAPSHCYLNLKTTYNITVTLFLLFKIYVQWHICLSDCYAIRNCNIKRARNWW